VSTAYTTRPSCSVVERPAGASVGKSMRTLRPVRATGLDPSGFDVACVTDPVAFNGNVLACGSGNTGVGRRHVPASEGKPVRV
jgi:hypothetical protein